MTVVILFNPRSGRGKALEYVASLRAALAARGHDVVEVSASESQELEQNLTGAGALVIVGGDGTVNRTLPIAERAGTPIYHFPTGNENLFARECGHVQDSARTVAILEAGKTRRLDLGVVARTSDLGGAKRFALMVSLGPDASVISRRDAAQSGSKGHSGYAIPILEELWDAIRNPRPPALRVWVDGKKIADDAGWLVVANSPRYALRLDPGMACRDGVDPSDGALDVAFFPLRSRLAIVRWFWRCWFSTAGGHPAFIGARGREIVVEGAAPWQIDGESGGVTTAGDRLRFECRPGAVKVFCAPP